MLEGQKFSQTHRDQNLSLVCLTLHAKGDSAINLKYEESRKDIVNNDFSLKIYGNFHNCYPPA